MIRTTPFHERLTELNDQHLFTHWSGYLSALRFSHAPKHEYFAVRNAVGVFDTSPLFKYRITGPDAVDFLSGVVVRDLSVLRPGRAAYTLWCDDRGFVMEDGVVFRQSENELLMTAARPMLSWLTSHLHRGRVVIEDVSDEYAHARRPGAAVARRAGRAGARGDRPAVLRARRGQARRRSRSRCRAPATPGTSASS